MTRLGSLVDVNPRSDRGAGPVSVIAISDIDAFTASAQPRILEGRTSARRVARSGDVLFACISPSMENGKVAVVPELETEEALVSSELLLLRAKQGVDPRMIWAFLRQPRVRKALTRVMTGSSGRRRIRAEHLADLDLEVPSDEWWANADRALAHLDEARRMHGQCSGLLRTLPGAAATSIAKGVTRSSLAPRCSFIFRSGTATPSSPQGVAPVLRARNVVDGRVDSSALRFVSPSPDSSEILHKGDLLVVRMATQSDRLGRCAVYEGVPEHSVHAPQLIRIRAEGVEPDFLWAWLQTEEARGALLDRASALSGQWRIGIQELMEVPVPVLDSDGQGKLAEFARRVRGLGDFDAQRASLLDLLLEAHLSSTFGTERVTVRTSDGVEKALSATYLPKVLEAASERQRELWQEVVRQGEGFGLGDLARSGADHAAVQHSLSLFEQLGLVVRDRDGDSYRWRHPDAEWEVLA